MAWNYGANFGGKTKTTWTSGANAATAGDVSFACVRCRSAPACSLSPSKC
ncbi:MAG: hypothetical protein ACPIOQ_61655 [Promethearchaeia archaeon]